ncbi:MAG: hypothetical protein QNK23_00965 [Crocinitomicaceae bacterium]|nr:hypothetical protein [Crocinitomicaceae bacterium]
MTKTQEDKNAIIDYFIKELSEGSDNRELDKSVYDFLRSKKAFAQSEIKRYAKELDLLDKFLHLYEQGFNIEEYVGFDGSKNYKFQEPVHDYNVTFAKEDYNLYRTKSYWRDFSMHMIQETEMYISSSEIMDASSAPKNERRACMSILSIVLSDMCENGEIVKLKVEGVKGYYYGLPSKPPKVNVR